MPHFPFISDDPGTVLDSFDDVPRAIPVQAGGSASSAPSARHVESMERLYQSPCRFAAPKLIICDYASLDEGEVVYLRGARTVIGRMAGDVVVPLDTIMSGEHAEIIRQDAGGTLSWILHDLDSSNGTLVRCRDFTLQSGAVLQIGSRRYRFEVPASPRDPGDGQQNAPNPDANHAAAAASHGPPSLVDCSAGPTVDPRRFILQKPRLRIGRPGYGNEVELEDPCVAPSHATIERDGAGNWQLYAKPTLNGVWAKVKGVKLTNGCLFQCGEQRFKFYEPR